MEEFNVLEPKMIAPQLTPEQRQALSSIDLLVQYIMPKLWDKVNYLEWATRKELHSIRQDVDGLIQDVARIEERLRTLEVGHSVQPNAESVRHEEKPKRGRRKKVAVVPGPEPELTQPSVEPAPDVDISEPVDMVSIAQYNMQTNTWVPAEIDGVRITAGVVKTVMSSQFGSSGYSPDVVAFVFDLSESERALLCATFPEEAEQE